MTPITKTSRLISLDVFRGLTVAFMIIVNSPGNNKPYAWLDHAAWDGCTLADLVFPFFIFIVGVSLAFTLTKATSKGLSGRQLFPKILKRSLIIFFMGLLLNAFPHHFDLASLRFLGVLQRIAICYLVSACLFLTTRVQTQIIIMTTLMLSYWLMMTTITVPGYGVNQLTEAGNLAAYLDRLIFSASHLYGKVFDPEGLLSTLPAIATALLGNITGVWLLSAKTHSQKLKGLSIAGVFAVGAGWMWGLWFPINKALWTSSYTLFTGGIALLVLAFCYWAIEVRGWHKWSRPFRIFGMNAMLAYVLHVFFLKLQAAITLPLASGSTGSIRLFLSEYLFGWASLNNASLLYALSYTLIWLLVLVIVNRIANWSSLQEGTKFHRTAF